MNRIRRILCLVLFIIAILFQGEIFGEYIKYVTVPMDSINFKYEDIRHRVDTKETKDFIVSAADESDVLVFAVSIITNDIGSTDATFYFSDINSQEVFSEQYYIYPGEYKSILYDNTSVKFMSFSDIEFLENVDQICILGESENIGKFTGLCFDNIECNFHASTPGHSSELVSAVIVWLVVIVLTIMLTLYSVSVSKKEIAVLLSFGENLNKIVFSSIIKDSVMYIGTYVLLIYILQRYTYAQFAWEISALMILILCIANVFCYMPLLFLDIKTSMYGDLFSEKLVKVSYFVKVMCCILAIVVFSSNFSAITECISFYKQKEYFENHKNYSYTKLYYNEIYENDTREYNKINLDMYRSLYDEGNVIVQRNLGGAYENILGTSILYFNKNAGEYLITCFDEFSISDFDKEKIYILIPNELEKRIDIDTQKSLEDFIVWQIDSSNEFSYDFEIVYYSDNVEVLAMGGTSSHSSEFVNNPVVFFNNVNEGTFNFDIDGDVNITLGYMYMMYDIDNDTLNDYLSGTDFELGFDKLVQRNVYQIYLAELENVKNYMFLNIGMALISLLLETLLIVTIVKFEYITKARELAIKTTLGYSKLSKYRSIWALCLCSFVIGLSGTLLVSKLAMPVESQYVFWGTLICSIIDITVNVYYINKVEQDHLLKLIKGGTL